MIECQELRKSFDSVVAVTQLSLRVATGECVSVAEGNLSMSNGAALLMPSEYGRKTVPHPKSGFRYQALWRLVSRACRVCFDSASWRWPTRGGLPSLPAPLAIPVTQSWRGESLHPVPLLLPFD